MKELFDKWMESQLNSIIKTTTIAMEQTMFRSAIQSCYFELQKALKWYSRRSIEPNKKVMNKIIESQILMLAPFTPFVCEEAWEVIGKPQFVSTAPWPAWEEDKINKDAEKQEAVVKMVLDDINSVLKLAKITKPSSIKLIISDEWKFELCKILAGELNKTRNMKSIMAKAMQNDDIKKHGQDASKIILQAIKKGKGFEINLCYDLEIKAIIESRKFFEKEFKCEVIVESAKESKEQKVKQARPGKPAIIVA